MDEDMNLTIEQALDMILAIDNVLIPQCRDFDTYGGDDGIYRIGDFGYVPDEVFNQAFSDYIDQCGGDEWARLLYILEGNQPKLLETFVDGYNSSGKDALEAFLEEQFDNDDANTVYWTTGCDE